MKQKGFTLIELIAMIVILAVIMILSFSSLTGTLKKTKLKEVEDFKDKLINAATIYVETNISEFSSLSSTGGIVEVEANTLIQKGYITNDIANPTYCSFSNIYIEVEKKSDKTLKYEYYCKVDEDGIELPIRNGKVIYYDPINDEYCSNYHEDNSLITYRGNNPTGNQTSCLKWYAFNDSTSSSTIKLLLDHNTTAYDTFSKDDLNSVGPGTELTNHIATLNNLWGMTTRLISADEIANIVGIEWSSNINTNSFYFTGLGTSASSDCTTGSIAGCKFGWLYDRTSTNCELTGCNNNSNTYEGSYQPYGYWTSSVVKDSNQAWGVFDTGRLGTNGKTNRITLGVRPVIEVEKP